MYKYKTSRQNNDLITTHDKFVCFWDNNETEYVLTKDIIPNAAEFNLYDPEIVDRHTKLCQLPEDIAEILCNEINNTYIKIGSSYRTDINYIKSFYRFFSLEDLHKMMPLISKKWHFVSDKEKTPLEKLFEENVYDRMNLD